MRYVVGFGRFWWNFIVGDDITLAIGGVGVIVLGALLLRGGYPVATEVMLPLTVVGTIAVSCGVLKR
ncbi:MAG: hypothetical protein EXR66_05870 [Dehalococcoidia bacterium]|nr:hypothetical protein [Dehalococcoidia bacterium]